MKSTITLAHAMRIALAWAETAARVESWLGINGDADDRATIDALRKTAPGSYTTTIWDMTP